MSLKHQVLSRLLNSETPKTIAETSEAKHSTILRWARELKEARANDSVSALMNMDDEVFAALVQGVHDSAPATIVDEVDASLASVTEAKNAASTLQADLQSTASALNMRIRNRAMAVDSIGELDMLAEALCKLQTAFFNKNATQVNVQNNYDSSNRAYATFLGDKPNVIN